MKKLSEKMAAIVIMPILGLIALFVWLGGGGGGPKTATSAVLGYIVLFVIGLPIVIIFGTLFLLLSVFAGTSKNFKRRVKAMEKTLKRD